jgi:hypothetical protein
MRSSMEYIKQATGIMEKIKERDVQPMSVGRLDYAHLANALDVTARVLRNTNRGGNRDSMGPGMGTKGRFPLWENFHHGHGGQKKDGRDREPPDLARAGNTRRTISITV